MKKLLLTAICGCITSIAISQATNTGTLKGLVTDSATQKPLSYITLSLKDSLQQTVKSGLTKTDGSFGLSQLPLKSYRLLFIAIGYQTKTIIVPAFNHKVIDLGNIKLTAALSELKAVSVTASRPLVKQEIDRLSYDVQADPDSKALTVMDMIRRVPLLTVDGDDNIQLQGSGSYRIFINGKPSALLASSPKDVLRTMPASTIQKIEVITTPPSKYDSEGLAGIINIITFKTTSNGYNGSLTTRYSYPYGPSLSGTGTVKSNKFGASVFFGAGRQTTTRVTAENFRQTYNPVQPGTVTSLFKQQVGLTSGGNYGYGGSEMSYEIDSLNLLTANINYSRGKFKQEYTRNTQFNSTAINQAYLLLSNGGNNWEGIDAGVNYQLGFKRKKQQLLTLSYRYSYYLNGQHSNISAINRVNYSNPDYDQQNDAGSREHTFQLDYVHPFKQLTVEGGTKAILRSNFSEASGRQLLAQGYNDDPTRRNDFDYNQDVYSAYNSYQLKTTQWTFKAGVRLEHTRINANFITNNTPLVMNYINAVPSISAMRTLPNNQSLTFGYTTRLERPYIQQLNPFIDRTNVQYISTGNPNLRPVTSQLIELTHTKTGKGTLSNKLSYMYTGNSIVPVLSVVNDTSRNTYANAGNVKILRWNVSGNYPITNKLNLNFNSGLFYVWVNGPYNNRFYSNQGVRTNTFANVAFKPSNTWTVGATGGYNRRYILLQGSSNDYVYSSLSMSKTFLNKKATITAVVNNPYQKNFAFISYSNTPDFYQSNTSNQIYRTFNISFSYKFGRLSSDIKKNQRNINNDDKSAG
ncbi:outer membrane beta-barrel protein [Mucilaginibacter terrae]|uniref:outer membrane beta-barrel protein n=1 Tax=Mucilaginibacter terrae TaxID=1955052 RepID=UPI003629AF52